MVSAEASVLYIYIDLLDLCDTFKKKMHFVYIVTFLFYFFIGVYIITYLGNMLVIEW